MTEHLCYLPLDLLILLGFAAIGWLFLRAVLQGSDHLWFLSTALGLGCGLLTYALFVLSWIGVSINKVSVLAAAASLAAIFAIVSFCQARPQREGQSGRPSLRTGSFRWTKGEVALWLIIGLLVLWAAILAVGLSYYTWDDIHTWAVAGYGIALEGSVLAAAHWGDAGLLYPLNAQLAIAVFRILDGDLLPGSKLLFPALYASLLVGCHRFLRGKSVHGIVSVGAMVLLGSTPIMFTHATMGYTNLMFTFYVVIGSLWCEEAVNEASRRKAIIGGTLIALGIWTRPEGLVMAASVLTGLFLSIRLARRSGAQLMLATFPPMVVGCTWLVFLLTHGTGTVRAYTDLPLALQGLARGEVHWDALWTIVRYTGGQVLRFKDWGGLLAFLSAGVLVGLAASWRRWSPTEVVLGVLTAVSCLVAVGAHYMVAYSPEGPKFVYKWLTFGFTRVLMPAVVLALLWVVLLFAGPREGVRSGIGLGSAGTEKPSDALG